MAKEVVLNPLKKSKAEFNLIGKAKVSDFTFKLNKESSKEDSDWIYNQMNLGIDCNTYGVIYADLMSGYGSDRENKVFVHGKKKNDQGHEVDDFKNGFEIAWEDRLDEDNYEVIGDRCFITVGLEVDENGKTVYKKFLTGYDAIQYISENIKEDMVVNVKGSIKYNFYNDSLQAKKEITSIALSKAEPSKFKASFAQALILDAGAIGKPDKETMLIPIDAMVIDFTKEYNGETITKTLPNGKTKEGCNLPLRKTFFVKITEDKEKLTKFLKLFKTRPKFVTQFTIEGYFTKGDLTTTEVSDTDIPDDIKELIEMGYIDRDEIMGKIAFANGGAKKPEQMIISAPYIKFVGTDVKVPTIEREDKLFTEDDIVPLSIIKQLGATVKIKEDKTSDKVETTKEEEKEEEIDMDKLMDDALEKETPTPKTEEEKDEDDWLNDLN